MWSKGTVRPAGQRGAEMVPAGGRGSGGLGLSLSPVRLGLIKRNGRPRWLHLVGDRVTSSAIWLLCSVGCQ